MFYIIIISGDSCIIIVVIKLLSTSTFGTQDAIFKLPSFWPADRQVWFAQVEAQFTTHNISFQKTKFNYAVTSLSPEIATEVRDLILTLPIGSPYDILKEQLIKRMAASEQRQLQQLFQSEVLGDCKLSQLLHQMQQLLGDKANAIDGSLLRELFLQCLLPNVRIGLASTNDTTSFKDIES